MKHKHKNITSSLPVSLHKRIEESYEEANNDQYRLSVINEWKRLDNEDNVEGWEWKDNELHIN